jgi:hypothetical protein
MAISSTSLIKLLAVLLPVLAEQQVPVRKPAAPTPGPAPAPSPALQGPSASQVWALLNDSSISGEAAPAEANNLHTFPNIFCCIITGAPVCGFP